MEKKLKALFDFQKFEGNPALQSVIDSVHSRYSRTELNLDEVEWVSAAGTPGSYPEKKSKESNPDAVS